MTITSPSPSTSGTATNDSSVPELVNTSPSLHHFSATMLTLELALGIFVGFLLIL